MTGANKTVAESKAGKHLTFRLGSETYGLEILKGQEIIGMMRVTRVPRTPPFVRGVINLRGKVFPVIDLRTKFGLETIEDTPKTCIIVVQVQRDGPALTMGVVVDEVSEVMNIRAEQIEPAPEFGSSVDTTFILGMGKKEGGVVILLDVDKVLTGGEVDSLDQVTAPAEAAGA
jgi:purine-binding chemotaxis protein CheW